MSREIVITCTDRGRHGRVTVQRLKERESGGVEAERTYETRGEWSRSSTMDEISVTDRAVMLAPDPREDFDGRERWRLVCRKCGRDVVLSGEKVRLALAARVASLDISLVL